MFTPRFRVSSPRRIVAAYDRKKPAKPELGEAVTVASILERADGEADSGAALDHAGLR